jgi:hypothetical protein
LKKLSGLDKYVIFSITVLLIYTIVNTYLCYKTGYENQALTTCFFSAFGGETLFCAIIQIFKIKKGADNNAE